MFAWSLDTKEDFRLNHLNSYIAIDNIHMERAIDRKSIIFLRWIDR